MLNWRITKNRFLFFLVGVLLLVFTGGKTVYAKISVGGQRDFEQQLAKPGLSKEGFDFQSLYGSIASLNTLIIGCTTERQFVKGEDGPNQIIFQKSACPKELSNGAVYGVNNMIASLYSSPPASGVEYLADVARSLGIVQPVYAQTGTGFRALRPVLEIWKAFRNLAYVLFIIAFVVIGFAIMFRVRISPQTVVTLQSALPRIVIALLLVTFSYAIAGLLVDLIYVFIALFLVVLGPLIADVQRTQEIYLGANFGTVIAGFMGLGGGIGAAWTLAREFFGPGLNGAFVTGLVGALLGSYVGPFGLGALIGGGLGLLGGGIGVGGVGAGSVLAVAVFAVLLFYAVFRLFIVLLMSYVQIILGVILAPLQITLDVIPGQNGFGKWLRSLFAHIFVFPLTVILLVLGTVISRNVIKTGDGWSPPPLGIGHVEGITALISFGILIFTPTIVSAVRDAIAGPPLLPLGAALGQAVGPPRTAVSGLIQRWRSARRVRKEREQLAEEIAKHMPAGGGRP